MLCAILCLSSDAHASPKPARAVTSKFSLGRIYLEEAVLIAIHDQEIVVYLSLPY